MKQSQFQQQQHQAIQIQSSGSRGESVELGAGPPTQQMSSEVSLSRNEDNSLLNEENSSSDGVPLSRNGNESSEKSTSRDERVRRVSFPVNANELVTGYLEPANPWASIKSVDGVNELTELYRKSCVRHQTTPNDILLQHLASLNLNSGDRIPILNLKEQYLTSNDCEALEEVLKRVQYRVIDVTSCGLDDVSSAALFDMIEYYEATNELNISDNKNITNRGWQACISMVKKSQALQILAVRGIPLNDQNSHNLGKVMMASSLHTLKLEHCGLTGRPLSSLCTALKRNTVLKELWLAHNDLTEHDAYNIGLLLKFNFYIQFLDVSNNYIADLGVSYIVDALIEQANKLTEMNNQTEPLPILSNSTLSPKSSPVQDVNAKEDTMSAKDDDVFEKIDVDVGKGGGRSRLDVLLTANQLESTTPSPNTDDSVVEHQSDIIVQKTNVELLNTIYENQTLSETTTTTMTPQTIEIKDPVLEREINLETNVNLVHQESCDKLDPVTEEPEEHLEHEANNSQIIVQPDELIPNKVKEDNDRNENISADDDGGLLTHVNNKYELEHDNDNLAEECKEDIIELKIIEEKEENENANENKNRSECDNNNVQETTKPLALAERLDAITNTESSEDITPEDINRNIEKAPKLNIIYDTSKNDDDRDDFLKQSNDSDMLDKSTESFEFIDPTMMITSPSQSTETATTTATTTIPTIAINSASPKQLSTSFDDSILMKSSIGDDDDDTSPTIPTVKTPDFQCCDHKVSAATTDDAVGPANALTNLPPPERSFSSDSLNSDTSIDSNDSKSSIKLAESKFVKNGTLERQPDKNSQSPDAPSVQPSGLQVLVLWNNQITRYSSKSFSELLSKTNSLDILNIGHNVLNNDFVSNIKSSLKSNTTVTNLGLQSAQLSCAGIKNLAEIIEFGGNSSLQRIDLRDNNIDVTGLTSIEEAMKNNKTVTRIDLDDTPSPDLESNGNSTTSDYTRLVTNIRAQCTRNENPPPEVEILARPNAKIVRTAYKSSRKISLTCQSIRPQSTPESIDRHLLDPNQKLSTPIGTPLSATSTVKSIGRLRSPLPSPCPSPMSSPIPSPSRSRFQVSKVLENISVSPSSCSLISTSSSTNSSPSGSLGSSRFRVTAVSDSTKDKKTSVTAAPTIEKSTTTHKASSNNFHNEIINFNFNFDDTPILSRSNVMDDSCSSLSSIDSIDRPINTSSSNDDSSSLDNIIISPKVFTSTLLSESLSSQDSFSDNNKFIIDHLKSDDDDTLTNASLSRKQPSPVTVTKLDNSQSKSVNIAPRVRKSSFLSSPLGKSAAQNSGNAGGSGSAEGGGDTSYSHGIEKLLSIFRSNPIASAVSDSKKNSREEQFLVSASSSPDFSTHATSSLSAAAATVTTAATTATRKDSPMSNLFALFTHSSNKKNPPEENYIQPLQLPKPKSSSHILQHKFSDNNLTDSVANQQQIAQSTNVDNSAVPSKMHKEIKENISPENTITKDALMSIVDTTPLAPTASIAQAERVHFEVGGDDDEDEDVIEDDDDSTTIDTLSASTVTTTTATILGDVPSLNDSSQNELSLNSKLGQTARDSLQILKGGRSNDSEDSMKSLELDTIPASPPNTEPVMPCSTQPYQQISIQPFPKTNNL